MKQNLVCVYVYMYMYIFIIIYNYFCLITYACHSKIKNVFFKGILAMTASTAKPQSYRLRHKGQRVRKDNSQLP